MSTVALDTAPLPAFAVSRESLRRATLWLMAFGSAVTIIEPGPFEIAGLLALVVWSVTRGLTLPRELVPIAALLILDMVGASMSYVPVMDKPDTTLWLLTGWFLIAMGLVTAVMLAEDTGGRIEMLVRGMTAGGLFAATLGILAWFRVVPHPETFLLYGRAAGTFDDPNVFGPFLALPMLVIAQRFFLATTSHRFRDASMLGVMTIGLFLSFSRGAWGVFAGAALLMTAMTFLAAGSQRLRVRILVLCGVGVLLAVLLLAGLLSVGSVSRLFEERAALGQSYDTGHFGRFNRWILGSVLALDKPNGIGMLQFAGLFGEEPHNSFLNAFMAYGWLGGIVFPAIVIGTVVVGFRYCLVPSPWRHLFICVQAAYVAQTAESWVISVDHWRHLWLLFGAVWGLSIATARLKATRRLIPEGQSRYALKPHAA